MDAENEMYMLLVSKLFMKWLERYDLSLFLMVVSDRKI